jgi:ABC-type glycerol-3-phosphate transport system substrate-binding protein
MKTKMSRREMLKMMALTAAAGALAACGQGQPVEVSDPEVGDSAPDEQASLVWDTFRTPGTGWNEERIATFKSSHPNTEIEFRPLGGGQMENYARMYAMHAAGDLGDIIAFDPSHYHFIRAIDRDIIMPIDDLIETKGLDLTQWFDMFIAVQRHKGQIYGLPSWGWAGQDSLVVNKKHFDEAGIDLPDPTSHTTSMDTIAEWARTLYSERERYGLAMPFGEQHLTVLLRAFNADLINEEGTQCLLLEDENAQTAVRWAYDLAVVDQVLPISGDLEGGFASAQLEGMVTMVWAGSLNVRNYKRDLDPETAEAWQVLFPVREDGRYPTQVRGGTWNINKRSRHPSQAFDFLTHITSTEGTVSFNLVANQGALVRPDVLDILIARDTVHEWFIPNLNNGIYAYGPANSRGTEYTDAVQQWMDILMDRNNPVDFDRGLEDLHSHVQRVLDEPLD